MFILKKLLARIFFPVALVLELFLLGWMLQRCTRFKRLGSGMCLLAFGLLAAMSYPPLPNALLGALEQRHPPLTVSGAALGFPTDTDIVVLGQGLEAGSVRPGLSRVNSTLLARILEGVRLHRLIPGSRILLSIGGRNDAAEENAFVRELAGVAGFDRTAVVLIRNARDTDEELTQARQLARTPAIVLVTSAAHIPRAMRIAERAGFKPCPAPCDYCVGSGRSNDRIRWSPVNLFPNSANLANTERVMYEYLGLAFEAIRRN